MIDKAACLRYYKRPEIQRAIVENARGREVAVKYGDKGFGKRPDILNYPGDILEFAKQGVSSFHISEERWSNPLHLKTGLTRKQLDDLRSGWDLVIDIDSKDWRISKVAAWIIFKALSDLKIRNTSIKFSGNKGFHLGVPFESFPFRRFTNIKNEFPELPKKIAGFLVEEIDRRYISIKDNNVVVFAGKEEFTYNELKEAVVNEKVPLLRCRQCRREKSVKGGTKIIDFVCSSCESVKTVRDDTDYLICDKCKTPMEKLIRQDTKSNQCVCGSVDFGINPLAVIEIDTLLISSRHMYRGVFSLHEKSGLASIPISPEDILNFDKKRAEPDNVRPTRERFLVPGEGRDGEAHKLYMLAADHDAEIKGEKEDKGPKRTYESLESAAPEEIFPPCIKKILEGLKDGRKRSLFILTNFLSNVGWEYDDIESLMKEWNKKNGEPLSETILTGHVRYHKQKRQGVLPPNCDNKAYYSDMGVCIPDDLCSKIRNPANYTRRKAKFIQSQASRKKKKSKPVKAEEKRKPL